MSGATEMIPMSNMKNWPNPGTVSLGRFEPCVGPPREEDIRS